MTDTVRRPLGGFHVEAARRITGKKPYKVKRGGEEVWIYPHSADVLAEVGLRLLRHYIDKRRATIAKTIRDRPILLECGRAERLEGTPCRLCWWQQILDYSARRRERRREPRGE